MFNGPISAKARAYLRPPAARKDMQKKHHEKRPDAGNTRPLKGQWTMTTCIMRKTAGIGNDAMHMDMPGVQHG